MPFRLYVGNLSFNLSGQELEELFSQVGAVESTEIVTDRDTGRSRGFAIVEMKTREAAEAAIQSFNGRKLDGRSLTINEARPRETRSGRFGGGGTRERSAFGGGGSNPRHLRTTNQSRSRKKQDGFDTEQREESMTAESTAEGLPVPAQLDAFSDVEIKERYSMLVDKKYSVGLSKEEAEELSRLKQQIDDENAAFYEPIIQRLTAIEEGLKAKSQQAKERE